MTHPSVHLQQLLQLHDQEDTLNSQTRIKVYKDLLDITTYLDLNDLQSDVIQSVRAYYKILREKGCVFDLLLFEHTFQDQAYKTFGFITFTPTVYDNPQNVHVFADPTTRAAKNIIKKYPAHYFRPTELANTEFDPFFQTIETTNSVHGIQLTKLFASIWLVITIKDKNLVTRLIEEIKDTKDVCLTGYVVRLVNVLSGTLPGLGLQIEQREYNKSFIFHQINKNIDAFDVLNIQNQVKHIINNLVDKQDIPTSQVLYALEAYTKIKWYTVSGTYNFR